MGATIFASSDVVPWFVTAIVTVSVLYLLLLLPKRSEKIRTGPPRPKTLRQVFSHLFSGDTPFYLMRLARAEQTKVYTIPFLFGLEFTIVADAAIARQILDHPKNQKWLDGYDFMNKVAMGDTFFGSESTLRYAHVRKSTLKAFSPQNTSKWVPMIKECLQKWMDCTLGSSSVVVDIAEEMQKLTISVIGKVGFDCKLTPEQTQLGVESLQIGYQEFAHNHRRYPHRALLGGLVYPGVRRAHEAARDLNQLSRTILQNYRVNNNAEALPSTGEDWKPILHYIANDEEYKDDEERIRDIAVLFAGGYDTTSYTISWIMLELAKNPNIQTWLRRELHKLPPDQRHCRCVALKHCIREGMRLHPTTAIGALRITEEDIALPNKRMLHAGSIMWILTLAIQRDATVFDDPDEYKPRRWENATNKMNHSWLSFGCGRRSCIGQALAQAELQMAISTLVANYEWTVEEAGEMDYYVTLKTVGTKLKATKWD